MAGRPSISADKIPEIATQYQSYAPVSKIATQYGVTTRTIQRHLTMNGIPKRGNKSSSSIPKNVQPEIIRLYEDGWSTPRLSTQFGVSTTTIWRMLNAQGIQMRRPKDYPRPKDPKYAIARQLKQSGMTYAEIGEQLGVSRQRAQQLLSPAKSTLAQMRVDADNRCQHCGKKSKKLDAHHLNYEGDPEIILCPSCHKKADARLRLTGHGR